MHLAICAVWLSVSAAAANPEWVQITDALGTGPPALYWHSAAITDTGKILIFGGQDAGREQSLYYYDNQANEWTDGTPSNGSLPSGRRYTSISWAAGKLWLHGGDATGGWANDLWYITTEVGSLWVEATVTGNPLTRYAHTTVITAAGRLWVFGGYKTGGRANDLWYVDTEASNFSWHEATVTGDLPPTRYKHSAVISVEGVMWVFGGQSVGKTNDLWSIDLEANALAWQERSPSGTLPDKRADHTAVITGAGRMWIFGGVSPRKNDLWYIDTQGPSFQWNEVLPSGTLPETRYGHVAVVSPTGEMWIYGGYATGRLGDFWKIDLEGFTSTTTTSSTSVTSATTTSWSSTTSSASSTTTTTSTSSPSTTTTMSTSSTSTSLTTSSTSETRTTTLTSSSTLSSTTSSSSTSGTSSTSTTTFSTSTSVTTTSTSTSSSSSSSLSTTSSSTMSLTKTSSSSVTTTRTISTTSSMTFSKTTTSSATQTRTLSSTTRTLSTTTADSELMREISSLIGQLAQEGGESLSATTDLGTMVAFKLPANSSNSSFLPLIVENSPAAALLPQELVQEVSEGRGAVLVATTLDGPSSEGAGRKMRTNLGRPIQAAVPAVDISIVDVESLGVFEVQGTRTFFVRIAESPPNPEWICAYLDGDSWSTEGVRLATTSELEAALGVSADTSGVWCATVHLSIFGAFIDILLDCTNANMLTPEGLREIIDRQGWWMRPPALALFVLLVGSLVLIALGVWSDTRVRRLGLWRDENFLSDDVTEAPRQCCRRRSGKKQSKSKNGEAAPGAAPESHHLLRRLRQPVAAGLREFVIYRNTLWEVAREYRLHTSSIESHIWGKSGWIQGSLAMQTSPKLKELAIKLEEGLPRAFVRVHTSRFARVRAAMMTTHPVYELCMCDLHITAAKRAKIVGDCILGSLAFVALFFSVDGSAVGARSPEECPIEQGSFLWYTFVSLFSVLLNCVPRSLEYRLAQRGFVQKSHEHHARQLLRRQLKDIGFWLVGTCLSLCYLLVVTAFLANLSEGDEGKWMFSFAVVVVRKLVVVPVLATLLSSVGTELSICALSGEALTPPKKFGLDLQLATAGAETASSTPEESEGAASEVWHQKVRDLAGRGITVRQLLDFYADLGQRTMKHFEPHQSTTHDVVRQVIIPNSLQLREARFFFVLLRQVTNLAGPSKPYCKVSVRGPTAETKPWKGGGGAAPGANKGTPAWESQIVAEDVEKEDRLFFELLDDGAPPDLRNLGNLELPASKFWHGLRAELQLNDSQDIKLQVEITAHKTVEEAKKVAQKANEAHRSATKSKWTPTGLPWRQQRDHDIPIDLSDTDERVLSIESPRRYTMTIASWPKDDDEGPKTTAASQGYAYATVVNNGQPYLAQKMVTHGWRNKFTYLLAAIFADALDVEMYDEVAQLLAERQFDKLASALRRKGKLDIRYWVCAFCVNQHTGICATPPPTDSSGCAITPCSCGTSKSFTGDLSEMNKFDDMMAYLKKTLRAQGRVRLEQVVALETDFSLLTRVWCLAELVEAYEVHLPQAVKIHSAASRDICLERLAKLDVRDAEASFPADKELVLSKIDDMDGFNLGLQNLVMHRLEQFLQNNRACSAASLFDNIVLAALTVTM